MKGSQPPVSARLAEPRAQSFRIGPRPVYRRRTVPPSRAAAPLEGITMNLQDFGWWPSRCGTPNGFASCLPLCR
jgi:hypothetical protein